MKKFAFTFLVFLISICFLIGCGGGGGGSSTSSGTNTVLYHLTGSVTTSGVSSLRLSAQPVKDADVFLEEGVGLSAKTDSNGRYTIKNIPEGTYHVIAQKGNLKMRSEAITLNTELAPEGKKEIEEVEVKEANTIFDITLLDITGKTIINYEGAEIEFWNSNTTLEKDGTFLTPTAIPDELAVATSTFYGG